MRHQLLFALLLLVGIFASVPSASASAEDRLSHSKSVSRSQISRSIALEAKQVLAAPSVIKADSDTFNALVSDPAKFTIIFFHATWSGRSNRFASTFASVAEMYETNQSIQFLVLDVNENEPIARKWQILHFPSVKMVTRGVTETANTFHDVYDGAEAFVKFIERVLLHEKWKYVKRASTDDSNPTSALVHPNQGSVIELNTETFDNFTKSTQFFTFVMFYAPWCGACKEMEGELEAVARYFKRDKRMIIGRVNADDNPKLIDRYGISALPTMYMFPMARLAKRGIRYTGQRDRRDMQAIIDTQNRMADSPEQPYIDENTDMETLMAEMKLQGRDPETLMRAYAARSGQEYKSPKKEGE